MIRVALRPDGRTHGKSREEIFALSTATPFGPASCPPARTTAHAESPNRRDTALIDREDTVVTTEVLLTADNRSSTTDHLCYTRVHARDTPHHVMT